MTSNFLPSMVNHLWQSTLFALAIWLLTLTLRQNRAQVRYWLWMAASVKFLLPFSLFVWLGSSVEWRPAATFGPPVTAIVNQVATPLIAPLAAVPATSSTTSIWPPAMSLLWLAGLSMVAWRWTVRWRGVRASMRTAARLPIDAPVPVWSVASRIEPGIFGIFRPALLLPQGIAERLTPTQLRAVLAHEFCHVRRRDNQFAALHMLVEAIFWFHPLVWWLGSRLVEERERACDEEVLRAGGEPEAYAASILTVCRFYLESPLTCAAGVTGADLKKRVEAIMSGRPLRVLTPWRKVLLIAAGAAVIAAPLTVGMLRVQAQGTKLRFDAASIKPTKEGGMRFGMQVLPGDRLKIDGAPLKALIAFAYGVEDDRISGGPRWVNSDAYDIVAKADRNQPDDDTQPVPLPGSTTWERVRLRTQTLLEERFQLVVHTDSKEVQGYELLQTKGGPKLQVSPTQGNPSTMRSRGRIDGRRGTLPMLATVLGNYLGHPVADKTGLTGQYDYRLQYAQDLDEDGGAIASDITGPSIINALTEQLGLKLEKAKVKVVTVVIERAEKASEN